VERARLFQRLPAAGIGEKTFGDRDHRTFPLTANGHPANRIANVPSLLRNTAAIGGDYRTHIKRTPRFDAAAGVIPLFKDRLSPTLRPS